MEELVGAQGFSLAMLSFCDHGNPKFGEGRYLPKVNQQESPVPGQSVGVSIADFHLTLGGEEANK